MDANTNKSGPLLSIIFIIEGVEGGISDFACSI